MLLVLQTSISFSGLSTPQLHHILAIPVHLKAKFRISGTAAWHWQQCPAIFCSKFFVYLSLSFFIKRFLNDLTKKRRGRHCGDWLNYNLVWIGAHAHTHTTVNAHLHAHTHAHFHLLSLSHTTLQPHTLSESRIHKRLSLSRVAVVSLFVKKVFETQPTIFFQPSCFSSSSFLFCES